MAKNGNYVFFVPQGTKAILVKSDTRSQFYTSKDLSFSHDENKTSPKGTLAFARRGLKGDAHYIIEISTNFVRLNQKIIHAIQECLLELSEVIVGRDSDTVCDLAAKERMTTAQLLLSAWMIKNHANSVHSHLIDTALSVLGTTAEEARNRSIDPDIPF